MEDIIYSLDTKSLQCEIKWLTEARKLTPCFGIGSALKIDSSTTLLGTLGKYLESNRTGHVFALTQSHAIKCDDSVVVRTDSEDDGVPDDFWKWIWQSEKNNKGLSLVKISHESYVAKSLKESKVIAPTCITVFKGNRKQLDKQKVFKIGAGSGKTIGRITSYDVYIPCDGHIMNGLLIESVDGTPFCQRGDSGSVVFYPGDHKTMVAVACVYGIHHADDQTFCFATMLADNLDNYEKYNSDKLTPLPFTTKDD